MTSHRTTLLTLASLVVIAASMPSLASASSPLLGGYGGPGDGNQTILGSALLNGPRGGGGSGGGSGPSASSPSISSTSGPGPRTLSTRSPAAGSPVHGRRVTGATGQTPGQPSGPERASSAMPLGLSGMDLLYIVLVLGVLALTAVLTKRLTQIAVTGSTGS